MLVQRGVFRIETEPPVSASKTIFMFSGQGSQFFQMGRELFEQNDVFRDSASRLDALVREATGARVLEAIFSRSKSEAFDRTTLTHPAIFIVEVSLARTLMHAGVMPDMTLGASLGSFAAAAIAGFFDVEEALVAVTRQAAAIESRCERGGMLAVLGRRAELEQSLFAGGELAATNFDSHFVVSAAYPQLEAIEARLRGRDIAHQRLAVSVAFHSRSIDAAQASFDPVMRSLPIRPGRMPLVCCERAQPLHSLPDDFLWRCVRNPIRFHETITHVEQSGPHRYLDLGPSGTLATFVKYARPPGSQSTAHAILTPFGRDVKNLSSVLAEMGNGDIPRFLANGDRPPRDGARYPTR